MNAPMAGDPSPFFLPGGETGVLLIHGFTGSPAEMRRLGVYLHGAGLTVAAPLLPGHGTTAADCNGTRWADWTATVEDALAQLQARCRTVFAAGLSMGALLALHLAEGHPELAGAALYAPAIMVTDKRSYIAPLLKLITPSVAKAPGYWADPEARALFWGYDVWPTAASHSVLQAIGVVKQRLSQVRCPLLIVYSAGDPDTNPRGAHYVYEHAASPDKQMVELRESGHVITLDSEWEELAEMTARFVAAHVAKDEG